MALHKQKAGLQRPTREEYEDALKRAGNAIKEARKQSAQEKREVVQRFAEIILITMRAILCRHTRLLRKRLKCIIKSRIIYE